MLTSDIVENFNSKGRKKGNIEIKKSWKAGKE
jgi:hypothetical protein